MREQIDLITIPGKWEIPFEYSAGRVASRFFHSLKNEGKILATRCSNCQRVLVPPRAFCERCFIPIDEWVEVGPGGTLQTFTIVPEKFPGMPEPPYVIAYVQLDKATTSLVNFLKGVDLSNLTAALKAIYIGAAVRVVVHEHREGRITDFHYELAENTPSNGDTGKIIP